MPHCVAPYILLKWYMGRRCGYYTNCIIGIQQKGTIGLVLAGEDMPTTATGERPDIIINPHCIPSRMTIAQLKETLLGKVLLQLGMFGDGTSYGELPIKNICKELLKLGFEKNGNEILYNGMTGEQLETSVFIGPAFYQRLKHMVDDKEHSRAIGPMVVLTRQPAEGRSREGGLRFGEPFCQKVNMQIFASLRCGRQHSQIAGTSCIGS